MDEREQLKQWLEKAPAKTLWAINMVTQFIDEHWFGDITIQFQNGEPTIVKKSRTFKKGDLE